MSEWQQIALGELFKVKHGFAFKGEHFTDEKQGTVLVTPGNFAVGGGFQDGKRKYYKGPVLEEYVLKPGQVVVSMTDLSRESDTLGYAASIPDDSVTWLHNQRVGLLEFKPSVPTVPRFIEYLLRTREYRSWVIGSATGTTVKHTAPSRIESYTTCIPGLAEQHSIAQVLGALDDKIELNRRVNDTLEAMARAIFQSWFVDFDPVRAKAGGESSESICQRLYLTPELLALFPDDFEDAINGVIPAGWTQSTLGDQAKAHGGFIQTGPFGSQLHASDYVDEGIPVVMPQDLVNRRISVAKVARVSEEMAQRLSRHALQPGDVVYSRRGDVERHALISEREAGWLCGTGCLLVRLGRDWPSQAYLSEALDLPATREWLVRHAVGATMPNLNTSILGGVPLLIPPTPLMAAFEQVARSLRQQQMTNSLESESLAETRDALLPRLLSGELMPPELFQGEA